MGHHILYIEDDPFLSKTLTNSLAKTGAEVEHAANDEEAFQAIADKKFDLILLDLLLPGVDGFEILRKLKASSETKDIPVIVLSNIGDEEDVKKTQDLGAFKHYVKAMVNPRRFVNEVQAFLNDRLDS